MALEAVKPPTRPSLMLMIFPLPSAIMSRALA
jgi:hypothetical protein